MVGLYRQSDNPPVVHFGTLVEQTLQVCGYTTPEHPFTVLRNPNQMILEVVASVGSVVITAVLLHYPQHARLSGTFATPPVSDWCLLRHPPGEPFRPGLKDQGYLAVHCTLITKSN